MDPPADMQTLQLPRYASISAQIIKQDAIRKLQPIFVVFASSLKGLLDLNLIPAIRKGQGHLTATINPGITDIALIFIRAMEPSVERSISTSSSEMK